MLARYFVFLAIALTLSAPATAFADWPPLDQSPPIVQQTGKDDVAVIVAVEDYFVLPDVTGAIENANDWESFFRDGMGVETVHILANQDATRESMLKFARKAASQVKEGGTLWWIFIGHGAPDVSGEDGLIIGVDAQQSVESLQARGLPQKELLTALSTNRARTIAIVDACFSGRTPGGEALAKGVQPVVAVDATPTLGPLSVVFSAARGTEVAGQLEGTERPAFSYLMLGAMRGWADDGDGEVTAEEALQYTRRVLRGVKGRQQTPQAVGYLEATLSKGVTESRPPSVVAETPNCGEGEMLENGECVSTAVTSTPQRATPEGPSEAERTIEYLQRRLVWDGRVVRQAGRILEGPAFYHAIERPDLADKWKAHIPALWLSGIGITAAGVALFVSGIALSQKDTLSRGAQTGWFIGGSLGGFFAIAGGTVAITFGFIGNSNPMNYARRKAASEAWNKALREELDLGPEVDWQNQPATKKRFGPFGSMSLSSASPGVGFTIRF